ncbi:type 1 fimbrial protein [Serratia marcescens]|uniref:fimbrial protein n=1 Tax=Serratia TaxID=613 RepID=UPI00044E5BED|nr:MULTISPECIES: fimbrial protein [Serratia]AVN32292.1 type 1 fimbrial protein [Serratia marcescens]AVN52823.1 type 1 fimbrial protein [Serratia marcescens]AWC70014.1 type 1 fimbrial protein [Serratia marcescens]AWC78999.1 type 1 fimbrial protein [Serratia marcescens]AWC87964.1 type 1 fimbrial protein [Serratia marcescens]
MKLNKIMLAAVMTLGTISMANAANQGGGSVTFKGSIIDAPCSIEPGSLDQTVKLGDIASAQLKNGGKSTPQDILIKLVGCDVQTAKTVTTTFSGTESEAAPGLLAMKGSARGASIAINDIDGKLLPLTTASKAQKIEDGQATLRFSAHLQGDGASAAIVPGEFNSVADFTLAYQ